MGWFSKEPKETPKEMTSEDAEVKLKLATASARFGPVGRRDKTWTTSDK